MLSMPLRSSPTRKGKASIRREVQQYFVRSGRYTAGTATRYRPSLIYRRARRISIWPKACRSACASIRRRSSAWPMPSRCTWATRSRRTAAGASSPSPARSIRRRRPQRSGRCATSSPRRPESPVRRYTPAQADIDSVIDVRAVFQQGHRELDLMAMPAFLLPAKGRYGLRDYEKMFCPDLKSGHDIFDLRGIDRQRRLHGRRAARPVCRPCPSARCLFGAFGLLRRLHGAAELSAAPAAGVLRSEDAMARRRCYLAPHKQPSIAWNRRAKQALRHAESGRSCTEAWKK